MNNEKPTNGHSTDNPISKEETLKFPVTFQLKAVFDLQHSEDQNKTNLETVLNKLEIKNSFINSKQSSKGNFSSLSYEVSIDNKELMDKLYAELKTISGLKMAL